MDEPSASPFDDYAEPKQKGRVIKRMVYLRGLHGILRGLSAIAFCLAISSACVVLALDCLHSFGPFKMESWRLKSAFPLMFVGISYACLQFTLPRSRKELALGLSVGVAFVLWGVEQFVPYPGIAKSIDDVVMFLFVLDLSIVIRSHLRGRLDLSDSQ